MSSLTPGITYCSAPRPRLSRCCSQLSGTIEGEHCALSLSQDSNISDRFLACADGDGDIICSEGVPMSDADVDGLRSVFEAASLGATEVTLNDPTPSATRRVTSSPTDELSDTPAADSAPPTGGGSDSSSNAANAQSSGNKGAGVDDQSSGDQGAGGSSTTGSVSSPNSPGSSSVGAESSSNGAESSPNEGASSAGNDKPAAGRESSPDGPASSSNGPGSNTGDQSTSNLPDTEQGDASSNDDSASRNPGLSASSNDASMAVEGSSTSGQQALPSSPRISTARSLRTSRTTHVVIMTRSRPATSSTRPAGAETVAVSGEWSGSTPARNLCILALVSAVALTCLVQ